MENKEELQKTAGALFKSKEYEKSLGCYQKLINSGFEDAFTYNMIGHLYKKIDEYDTLDKQIENYQKSLLLNENFSGALRNIALACARAEKYDDSTKYFKKLFEIDPTPDDYFYYACMRIKLKDFEEGWKYYEYRFAKIFGPTTYPLIEKPPWQGENIKDKTLLIRYEQGFGDSLQFFRYIKQIRPRVGKIIFVVQKELFDLFKLNADGIEIVSSQPPLEELNFDYHLPIMSLPLVLNIAPDDFPYSEGYIKADSKKVEQYRQKYFDNDCLKIGISWHGALLGNPRRNVPLSTFLQLKELGENVKIYSFQKENTAKNLKNIANRMEIVNLGQTFDDFSDTAAAMENLDLFITSDNGIFNLAGAMGKKTYVLLGKDSEWRWFLDDKKTPWYDSVTIFKKEKETDSWNLAMGKIIKKIQEKYLN